MAFKGRLTKQVDDAIELMHEEGTILIPLNDKQYNEGKDYKFTIVEDIHKISKKINFQVQKRLYEAIKDKLSKSKKKIDYLPEKGIIRLR